MCGNVMFYGTALVLTMATIHVFVVGGGNVDVVEQTYTQPDSAIEFQDESLRLPNPEDVQ